MKTLSGCPSCHSKTIQPYSLTVESERNGMLHFSQSFCPECDLVFSNPMADTNELEQFYAKEYYEKHEEKYNAHSPDLRQKVLERADDEARGLKESVLPYKKSGLFFEIGAGYGALLEGARRLGFEVAGVEPSEEAAAFGREVLGLKNLKTGLFKADDWPKAFCDVIYSYHVVEHVPDPLEFAKDMFTLLKPGGIFVMGTENHRHALVSYRRFRNRLQGRALPEFQTASHHTYYFSDKSLLRILRQAGFEIIRSSVYTHALSVKLKRHGPFKSILSRGVFYALHWADVILKRGDRILIWGRKPS